MDRYHTIQVTSDPSILQRKPAGHRCTSVSRWLFCLRTGPSPLSFLHPLGQFLLQIGVEMGHMQPVYQSMVAQEADRQDHPVPLSPEPPPGDPWVGVCRAGGGLDKGFVMHPRQGGDEEEGQGILLSPVVQTALGLGRLLGLDGMGEVV